MSPAVPSLDDVREVWAADFGRVAARDRWGIGLIAVGGVHLGFFLACQAMHDAGDRTGWHYVAMWGLELAAAIITFGAIVGRGWVQSCPLAGLLARIWGTALILSLSLASLNVLSGLDHEWFKPVLCTLASFGFMMMAYVIGPRFYFGAVWMSLTGVLMVRMLDFSYLIHGISWFLALMTIGATLEVRRLQARRRARSEPARVPVVVSVRIRSRPGLSPGASRSA